jgi:hypothetical protein
MAGGRCEGGAGGRSTRGQGLSFSCLSAKWCEHTPLPWIIQAALQLQLGIPSALGSSRSVAAGAGNERQLQVPQLQRLMAALGVKRVVLGFQGGGGATGTCAGLGVGAPEEARGC